MRSSAYTELETRFKRHRLLADVSDMLGWDMATLMPEGGAAPRSEQLAMLGVMRHQMMVCPELGDLLTAAEQNTDDLTPWQAANLKEMRRARVHATAVPEDLVEAALKAGNACEMAWRAAKPANDFNAVLPYLTEVLTLSRHIAAAKAGALGCGLYDALLDEYEPGGRSDHIDALFTPLEAALPDLIAGVLEKQERESAPLALEGPFDPGRQRRLGERMMRAVGFDFKAGRLDVSRHPFCGGIPEDIRLTTRYDEADFTSALMGVLHETGHAQYERGLPRDWRYQPVGRARGMSLHESQSLLVEMQACRSEPFLTFAAPIFKEAFAGDGPAWERDNILKLYRRVTPGMIRVDADEVTYPAHVILRYRIEKELIEGRAALPDLPGIWNDYMQRLLGIVPETDTEGCLQDIHWFDGAWGYFPTYTLGAMAAAQIFAALKQQLPDWAEYLAVGDFSPLMDWLAHNIHSQASVASTDEILIRATGRPLGAQSLLSHLNTRYLDRESPDF